MCVHLVAAGWTILFRNLRLGALEIDVVARRGEVVAMCEVRTRGPGAYEGALASVGPEKRARLLRAADALFREHVAALEGAPRLRIDVAAVALGPGPDDVRVEYIAGAL